MNAVERLWRALRREDWEAAEAQLYENAVVRWPHTGERFDRAIDYLTAYRLHGTRTRVDVRRIVSDGDHVGLWAVVDDGDGTWHCGAMYELQDARIAHAVEVWTREGVERPSGLGS
jgi:ketosteroid isomerase-like protein